MDLLVLIHDEDAGPGVFSDVVSEKGLRCEYASLSLGRPPRLSLDRYGSVIVLGGEANVDDEADHPWLRPEKEMIDELLDHGTPLLGVCLGAQLLAEVAGARVGPLPQPEIGWYEVQANGDDRLLATGRFRAFQWHRYGFECPQSATELARNDAGCQAFRLGNAWGIQFHAEVDAPTVDSWIRDYGPGVGVDAEALAAETEREIARWSEFGRALCDRFLDQVSRSST